MGLFNAIAKRVFPKLFMTKNCFSQCGEELVITSLLRQIGKQGSGFYVDIGAFDPLVGSNTYYFYRLGWQGINIDARPSSMEKFREARPRDINLETGIGAQSGNLKYYMLESEPGMNTFSLETLRACRMEDKITSTAEVPVVRFEEIQKKHVPANTHIDFVSIDTEGHEMDVLTGFNFNMHRPSIFAVELNAVTSLQDVALNPVHLFLEDKGYVAVGKNVISIDVATVFYLAKEHLKA
ncbi:MAG: FkbM family methyltransferase [Bacteroidota bacterium]